MPFVKLDCGMLRSSIWVDRDARSVFLTALLLAEPVEFEKPVPQLFVDSLQETGWVVPPGWYGIARAAGIGIIALDGIERERGLSALRRLGDIDLDSRSDSYEGRRLVRVDGGYVALKFFDYRDRDYSAAERMRRYRKRLRERTDVQRNGNDVMRNSRHITVPSDAVPSTGDVTLRKQIAEVEVEVLKRTTTTIVGESQTTLLPDSSQEMRVNTRVKESTGDPDFDIAWSRYPKRHGTNNRADALKQWTARKREGENPATMIAGVERYAAAMAADNKIGTELVMAAQRFFGKAKHYLEPWSDAETDASALTPEDLAAAVRAGEEAFAERAWQEERERRLFEFQGENLGSGKPYREQAAALDCYMTDPTSPYNSPGEWVPKPTLIKS